MRWAYLLIISLLILTSVHASVEEYDIIIVDDSSVVKRTLTEFNDLNDFNYDIPLNAKGVSVKIDDEFVELSALESMDLAEVDELVFSIGEEKPEKSMRSSNNKKKKKKSKK